jgi:serine/threonine protein kinase
VLSDSRSLPASDLWSLGIIIYLMHVGKVPFDDKDKDQSIFQKILSLDFSWPHDVKVSIEAKDLVERLLKLNSRDRIGAG